MPSLELLLAFAAATAVFAYMPGPALLYTAAQTLARFEARSLLADRTPPAAYSRIEVPTLLLGGERSPVAARRIIALLAKAVPGARTRMVAGAGHMGPISHAAEVNALVAEHIATADTP